MLRVMRAYENIAEEERGNGVYMTRYAEMIRGMFEATEKERLESYDTSITERTDIERLEGIQYGEDEIWNTLDIYRPLSLHGRKLPVIVNVHGGGWIFGSKDNYRYYCEILAAGGYAVINFNYRLVPAGYFPAPVEDLNKVIHWILKNGEHFLLDTEHISGVGDSAGAHTLAMYATMCVNREYAARFSFEVPQKQIFDSLILNCGVFDSNFTCRKTDFVRVLVCEYLHVENKEKENMSVEEYRKNYEEALELFDFTAFLTQDFPNTLLTTAENDFVKMHSAKLMKKFVEKNVKAELKMYVSKREKLGHVFNIDLKLEEAQKCNDEALRFLEAGKQEK